MKKQLRLEERFKFRTNSDTEVVLYLYQHLGMEFIKYLSGMFAIAIYDSRLEKIFIVRDLYGINPLFIYREQDRVILLLR